MTKDTDIKFNTSGKRNLGTAISTDIFRSEYATEKLSNDKLSEDAKSQPQAFFIGVQLILLYEDNPWNRQRYVTSQ